ncbi:hypothetical protein KBY97_04475 [Synechococcus sp. ATX 2A4]|uniref:hypothetical protein n=1 Tax=Synechococcus sp. ATX 2A4 TaxID=2823727 RepID=UPI0020CD091F|nr:hypothetical protein [Synechococcus sp. ATX 2A4]MCP9884384.1 hypothetical protein [Synechococcus sp. ATX 2A4]
MSKLFPSSRHLAAEARYLPTVEGQQKPRELMALVRGKVGPKARLTNSKPLSASAETTQTTDSLGCSGSLFYCSEFVLLLCSKLAPSPLITSIMPQQKIGALIYGWETSISQEGESFFFEDDPYTWSVDQRAESKEGSDST